MFAERNNAWKTILFVSFAVGCFFLKKSISSPPKKRGFYRTPTQTSCTTVDGRKPAPVDR